MVEAILWVIISSGVYGGYATSTSNHSFPNMESCQIAGQELQKRMPSGRYNVDWTCIPLGGESNEKQTNHLTPENYLFKSH